MIVVEIPPNPNCDPVDMRIFNAVDGGPRPVRALCVARAGGVPAWHDVIGWTAEGQPCPAQAAIVEDSGEGLATLIYGGTGGLRFRQADSRQPWDAAAPEQWGLPFYLTTDVHDIRFDDEAHDG
jgi:hypothetical protein